MCETDHTEVNARDTIRAGMRFAKTALAAAVMLFAVTPVTAPATVPGQNGKIAYTERVTTSTSIRTVNPDGTGDVQVIANGYAPAWSPDGTKLAYTVDNGSFFGGTIKVADPDGSNPQTIATGYDFTGPAWSPDGTKIIFAGDSTDDSCQHLYVVDYPPTSAPTSLTTIQCVSGPPHQPAEVDWSPRGDKVAFDTFDGSWVSYVINADGSGSRVLVGAQHPSWSPSGDWVAYSNDGAQEVQRDTPDGLNRTSSFPGRQPDFSPDGSKLVVMNSEGGLDVVNDAGGGRVTISTPPCSNGNCDDRQPDWQPVPPPPPVQGYPRPKGASPMSVSLVPAYESCDAPNTSHGAPLSFGSCGPPAQSSSYLTVGTPDANGTAAASIGRAQLTALPGDVRMQTSVTDVRCRFAGPPGCDGGALSDYTGSLREMFSLQIEDQYNGGRAVESATSPAMPPYQMPYLLVIPCTATAGTPGATCALDTTADALIPGSITQGKRMEWELGQVQLWDAGEDGNPNSDDNTLFEVQGLFVP